MHVPQLQVISYCETFKHGRSRPLLVWAEDSDGSRHEVVLKLRETGRLDGTGLAAELIASQLASDLGLTTPPPFVVEVTPEFAASVPHIDAARRLSASPGLHFASRLETGQFHLPLTASALPAAAIDSAAAVMAFDLLIGNDDRHVEKANCLVRGAQIVLIDHERAFPILRRDLRASAWQPGGLDNLHRHVFFAALKGQMPDFAPLASSLSALPAERIDHYIKNLPLSWLEEGAIGRLKTFWLEMRSSCHRVGELLSEAVR